MGAPSGGRQCGLRGAGRGDLPGAGGRGRAGAYAFCRGRGHDRAAGPATGATTMSKTIVFVHGAWLTSLSWENFLPYFTAKGYTCQAPEWPLRDKSVAEL